MQATETTEPSLLSALHANLWESLRHVFNTDRILLAVTYTVNFAGFVMLSATVGRRPTAAALTVVALVVVTTLIMLSLLNSRREAESLLRTLAMMYRDQGLGAYFDDTKIVYYRRRYALWLILAPALCGFAIALGSPSARPAQLEQT